MHYIYKKNLTKKKINNRKKDNKPGQVKNLGFAANSSQSVCPYFIAHLFSYSLSVRKQKPRGSQWLKLDLLSIRNTEYNQPYPSKPASDVTSSLSPPTVTDPERGSAQGIRLPKGRSSTPLLFVGEYWVSPKLISKLTGVWSWPAECQVLWDNFCCELAPYK